ncbi:MAG TPA: glycosyltransferase, partial [Phycisphaerae bacterium]|nr:glycosyltransferase [Phycisphaerae bacterium]
MRIALVIERLDSRRGGRELSTVELAAALAEAGQDVTVLTMEAADHEILGRVHVDVLAACGAGKAERFGHFAAAVAERKKDFDIVHGMTAMPCLDVYQPRGGSYREAMLQNAE